MKAKFIFLGSGGSMGVPEIPCTCATCGSFEPKNKRLRPSALLQVADKNFVIDIGPDFRIQALNAGIHSLEGLFITHAHFDHTACIDELRVFSLFTKENVHCLVPEPTFKDLQKRFYYLFEQSPSTFDPSKDNQKAQISFQVISQERSSGNFRGLSFRSFRFFQGKMPVHGYRFKNFAYVTDIRTYSESIFEDLVGVDTLVLSASSVNPNKIHFSLPDAIDFAKKVRAQRVYFTHMSHRIDYLKDRKDLPQGMDLAYDGLELDVEIDYERPIESPSGRSLSPKR